MKKILLAMCVLALSSGMAFAACDGGAEIAIGEKNFCVSSIRGNWWSMQAWCQAHGMTMASMYDVCPNWNGNDGGNIGCVGFLHGGEHWTSTVSGTNQVYTIWSNSNASIRNRSDNMFALCK